MLCSEQSRGWSKVAQLGGCGPEAGPLRRAGVSGTGQRRCPEPAFVLSVSACGHRDPVPQPFLPPYHRLSHWAVSSVPTTGLSGLPTPPGAPATGDSHILAPSHPCPRTPTQYFGLAVPSAGHAFPRMASSLGTFKSWLKTTSKRGHGGPPASPPDPLSIYLARYLPASRVGPPPSL